MIDIIYAVIERHNPDHGQKEYLWSHLVSSPFGALRFDDDLEIEDYTIRFGGWPVILTLKEAQP